MRRILKNGRYASANLTNGISFIRTRSVSYLLKLKGQINGKNNSMKMSKIIVAGLSIINYVLILVKVKTKLFRE